MSNEFISYEEQNINTFNQHRPRLFGSAYRILGTHAESADILQEAYLKWHQANEDEIETPEAWLVTIMMSIVRWGVSILGLPEHGVV